MDIFAIYARADAYFAGPQPDLIQRGNVDIEDSSSWSPATVEPTRDLAIYPTPADLQIPTTHEVSR